MNVRLSASALRGARVVGAIVVGSVLIIGSLFTGDGALFGSVFLLGPPLLGMFSATLAGRKTSLLVVASVTFVILAIAFLIALGPGGRAEGGTALVIIWLIPAELFGLFATDAVLRVVDRRRRARPLGDDSRHAGRAPDVSGGC